MVVGTVEWVAGLAASSLWVSPWELFQTELYRDWGELILVAVFLALGIIWMIMDRQTPLRFWLGVMAVALGVKIAVDDGPIARTVTDAAIALPRAAINLFR